MTPELNWLSDPTVFAVNRLDAHSDHVCYRTVQEAAQRHSSLRQPLDGMWRFVWSSCPAQRPADFWREGADLSGFGTIRVPGHMGIRDSQHAVPVGWTQCAAAAAGGSER